jgi:hypothetical protein
VFSTNLDLGHSAAGDAQITDAAFLRRIPNKIHVGHASPAEFHEIFRRVCQDGRVTYDAALVDQLIEFLRTDVGEPLRPCVPRDLVRQITWEARYDGRAPEFTDAALARACRTYFALPEDGQQTQSGAA